MVDNDVRVREGAIAACWIPEAPQDVILMGLRDTSCLVRMRAEEQAAKHNMQVSLVQRKLLALIGILTDVWRETICSIQERIDTAKNGSEGAKVKK